MTISQEEEKKVIMSTIDKFCKGNDEPRKERFKMRARKKGKNKQKDHVTKKEEVT